MKLSIGIVGLPNVGKSTLFNALLKKQVADAANYPFCTIEPNVGIVEVPDERLPILAKIVKTEKIVPAAVEFYDIAGIVKGASEGEGLGNKFLSHIREVSAIVHVVRLFDDPNVIHVANKVDPKSDMETIDAELILADLETLSKQKEPRGNADKKEHIRYAIIQRFKSELNKGVPARNVVVTDEEIQIIRELNLLTLKPVIYAFNVSEEQLSSKEETIKKIQSLGINTNWLFFNAKLENDVLALSAQEQKEYLNQYGLEDTGLNRLIKKSYEILGLVSFLTAGVIEAKAWTITKGTLAPQAAGTIHTDFEKKFIKADIVTYDDFVACEGWVKARETGKVVSAGKDYMMKDGDVVEFKVGS
ncbi:redox-regulated ATPase YchF [Candidatus Roizmanbacteria bacterium RIFOXYB2_FULL_38_10]|uniref:Ribosome-binding ATPase YchF n=1 Tax=Candidatus Roizmanbacteria bacterium RIFOXYD1_FULL_38_12 TaxID=1802093 RepID=A0A1F7L188_9BACT|nr:MAG: redox-regulated ATPase YchF [Candidatus Roizmanbacteria bacterium RIFOXYA2_FULL_38_14]OGK63902.1 MAG: redox-regulated ATPase YchF [Candidatus Roizmanbacteria bacterium RIFOXYA1_FULL_37_12]OGK65748.1 MAG: redox-regulated ATPase YchF [Candidatus Roizmanbacteria bacterium RIFOXYB1_FULL_40_23]OGK68193.1 MAG: redox-regulated ATPase YchF [Candidatus Roizmanbacteria bacterium RIFOXYB2_FULL_38_10]OGK70153.1 MAG: redox-regulated ATPase YchF [Candidatus Roizmanbacteria bacterium RIFOXYC1_FULL_38_